MNTLRTIGLNAALALFAALTLAPFAFVLNNSFRSNSEMYRAFFGLPRAATGLVADAGAWLRGAETVEGQFEDGSSAGRVAPNEAMALRLRALGRSYRMAWAAIRPYMLNTIIVCGVTACGVVALGSVAAYVLSRYRFFGSRFIFYYIISAMMFPAVLTLIPSFLLVRELGLLNSYWVMILPYMAGGQVFAVFVFRSFFDGLPEELFESARMDGAGHFAMYRNIVLPLSKPVIAVVMIMNVLGTWNNFLWPFITNTDERYHVIASGLFIMATSPFAQNLGALYAAYIISSAPLLILFIYATRPFIQGVTSGAFKA